MVGNRKKDEVPSGRRSTPDILRRKEIVCWADPLAPYRVDRLV